MNAIGSLLHGAAVFAEYFLRAVGGGMRQGTVPGPIGQQHDEARARNLRCPAIAANAFAGIGGAELRNDII